MSQFRTVTAAEMSADMTPPGETPRTPKNADGTDFTETMLEVQYTVSKPTPGIKWRVCSACAIEFPESEMQQVGGRWLCTKYKCNEVSK